MFRLLLVLTFSVTVFGQLAQEEHPAPEPYSFAFSSPNEDGTSSSREETGDASGRITGSYTIQGADGQSRRVEYVADENGFRANVITNEIGTESQDTADVAVKSSAPTAAQLTAEWEASGAGRVRQLAAPQQVIARSPVAIQRGAGLVSAPIAPLSGGLNSNLRINQGFGLRAQPVAPIAATRAIVPTPVPAVATRLAPAAPIAPIAPVAPVAPVAPITSFAQSTPVTSFAQAAPIARVAPVAPAAPIGRLAPFQGLGLIRPQAISPFAGVNTLGAPLNLNELSLGASPLQLQSLGLGLRGLNLAGIQNGGNLLFVPGTPQSAQGLSAVPLEQPEVQVNNEDYGRKY